MDVFINLTSYFLSNVNFLDLGSCRSQNTMMNLRIGTYLYDVPVEDTFHVDVSRRNLMMVVNVEVEPLFPICDVRDVRDDGRDHVLDNGHLQILINDAIFLDRQIVACI